MVVPQNAPVPADSRAVSPEILTSPSPQLPEAWGRPVLMDSLLSGSSAVLSLSSFPAKRAGSPCPEAEAFLPAPAFLYARSMNLHGRDRAKVMVNVLSRKL